MALNIKNYCHCSSQWQAILVMEFSVRAQKQPSKCGCQAARYNEMLKNKSKPPIIDLTLINIVATEKSLWPLVSFLSPLTCEDKSIIPLSVIFMYVI